ncbi:MULTISPECIES: hypothetical protein [Pseudonocardia]|uniref:Uncharacterized protein n=2 Tax=Pseudonocardia TaxID=1847 RepID=A0A1Y2MHK8_PSEAH|nr:MULTISPECIES: hypothetical protein [Pseudonocardia]OSY34571.1 hypothetical protein BG845_06724 [Pseudonocardia autotrophica]TDN76357.1 hypothetical protein C8E95_5552 [Pseudonocardia autotrophica]BBG00344.1 hypothetical protein Pdca_15530 [Pseudonocardia autotrophica]GEC29513.1 hypothetical protein PSA01_65420 [Pseudonocardia saturnea]
MPRYHVTVGILECSISEADLGGIQQDPPGWLITERSRWRSGVRLDLEGRANDPSAAERGARAEVAVWLGRQGIDGDVAVSRTRRELADHDH